MTSADRVFIITSQNDLLIVGLFDFDSTLLTITPTYVKTFGSASNKMLGVSVAFTPTADAAYVTGSRSGNMAITKIMLSAGTSIFTFYVTSDGSSSNKIVTKAKFSESSGIITN